MPDNYFARYLPLLLHFVVAGALAGAIVLLSSIFGYRRPSRAKSSPYECGMVPVGDARGRFSVKFYLVAMLFIIFDVEAVFLYPWAVILRELKMFGSPRTPRCAAVAQTPQQYYSHSKKGYVKFLSGGR